MFKAGTARHELRCFVILNQYLSAIHPGIQAAHALVEMGRDVDGDATNQGEIYRTWADEDATLILLSRMGYDHDFLVKLWDGVFKNAAELEIPASTFYEPGLNKTLTAIAFVLPECVYAWKDNRPWVATEAGRVRQGELSDREKQFQFFADLIQQSQAAR